MKRPRLTPSYKKFVNENINIDLEIDFSILDDIVELVGNEDDVEQCAKEAYEELEKSYKDNEIDFKEEDTPEKLAIASLLVKLVEAGKLDPEEADGLLAKYL